MFDAAPFDGPSSSLYDPDLPDAYAPPGAPTTWARAREDYLAGESASVVCGRYGLNRSTLFARAKAEGWRRSDGASPAEPDPYVAEMEAALVCDLMAREATPAYVLARRAWAMAEVALLNRRRVEAMGWIRIARELRKLTMEETGALTWRRAAQVGEEARAAQRSACELPSPPPIEASLPAEGSHDELFDEEAAGGEMTAALSPEAPAPSAEGQPATAREGLAPETNAATRAAAPDWGPLPMSILTSPRKLNAFLHGEFAEAWAASDSPDRSDRTAESGDACGVSSSSAGPGRARR